MLIKPQTDLVAKIKVIGVGGAGGNAVNHMVQDGNIQGVQFIAINTDAQALSKSKADVTLQVGDQLTRGLGSGGIPEVGKQAAEESVDLIHENLAGADMVFVTAGMGGGTGTGAAPIVSGIAKNLGALTVAIVTKPFLFEGKRRMENAINGIKELRDKVDTMIVVPNQRLLETIDKNLSFFESMKRSDDVLGQGVRSISDIITGSGFINVDFADVRSIMNDAGSALMGIGEASGDDRAIEAARQAVNSPLLEISIDGATGILFNIAGGPDLGLHEVNDAAQIIAEHVHSDANIIFGTTLIEEKENKDSKVRITLLATGFDDSKQYEALEKGWEKRSFPVATPRQEQIEEDDTDIDNNVREIKPKKTAKLPPTNFADEGVDGDDFDTPAFLRRKF